VNCPCCHAGEYYDLSFSQSLLIELDGQGSKHVNAGDGKRGENLLSLVNAGSALLAAPAFSSEVSCR